MGILGTDYTLRTGQVIFLLLLASSVLLGFSYLNEMYQRIQLREKMEIQTQRLVAERTIMKRKALLLQTQIESRNTEMKRMQDIHEFQAQQRNSVCEKDMNDLLRTISSKDDIITEVQNEYENLKKRFEHLRSVMGQFEKNQSRLLEKFSTQSTQCMNVINKLGELCNKGSIIRKMAEVTKENKTSVERPITQSSILVNATINTLLVSPKQDYYKTNENYSTEFSSPLTKHTTLDSDHDKQSSLKSMQTLQEMVSALNSSNNTKDKEDEVIKLERTENSTADNVFKSQTEEGGNDDENDLPKNTTIKEIVISQNVTTEQQTRRSEKLSALNGTSESDKRNQTNENVTKLQYATLQSNNESIQVTNQDSRAADRDVFTKEQLGDSPRENTTMTEDNSKSETKVDSRGKILESQKKPQRPTLEKIKTPNWDIYEAEESEYEDKEDVEKDLEINDNEMLESIF